jgi:hypothetical protein
MKMFVFVCIKPELSIAKDFVYILRLDKKIQISINSRETYVRNFFSYFMEHPIGGRMSFCGANYVKDFIPLSASFSLVYVV